MDQVSKHVSQNVHIDQQKLEFYIYNYVAAYKTLFSLLLDIIWEQYHFKL